MNLVSLKRAKIVDVRRVFVCLMVAWLSVNMSQVVYALPVLNSLAGSLRGEVPSLVQKVHVFGKDDRIELPEKYKDLRSQIGVLYNRKLNYGCTATCVAPDVILTAAHCVLKAAKRKRFPDTKNLQFILWASSRKKLRIGAEALYEDDLIPRNVVAGSPVSKPFGNRDFKRDWAFIKLQRKICGKSYLPLKTLTNREIAVAAKNGKLLEIGFHGDRDFGEKLLYTSNCGIKGVNLKRKPRKSRNKKRKRPEKPLRHTCDMTKGASGAPLLVETAEGLSIVAVNTSEFSQQKYLKRGGKIVKYYKKKAKYNVAINVSGFAHHLDKLNSSRPVRYEFEMKKLQQDLKSRKLYRGKIDGKFGPATWRAIRKYEKKNKRLVQGIPTTALLREFREQDPPGAIEKLGARVRKEYLKSLQKYKEKQIKQAKTGELIDFKMR